MHAFARECMLAAPEGSLNAVLVVEGHLERWVDLNGGSAGERYLRSGPVRDEIHEAASRSVWHPNFQRGYGWVGVQNTFAMVFGLMEDHQAAATQFVALGELATEDPWDYLGDPAEQFVRWRKQAMAAGVAK